LTEIIQLRERVFLKDNLARLGEMAAGIAHEFRNGLATILGNAKLLEQTVPAGEATDLVEALLDESNSLNQVMTEFLHFARPQSLRLVKVDLAALTGEVVEELETRARDVGVRLRLDAEPSQAEADEVLLKQAINNLVLNGIEAAAEAKEDGRVEVRTGEKAQFAVVEVGDNGSGIRKESSDRIFTPFFTTKPSGTGLGLALVQKIAVAHNGEVKLTSSTGNGATFTLEIPLRPEAHAGGAEWV
jgi:signal transduction histidine kinase